MIIRQMLDHDCRPIPQIGWVFFCLLHDKQCQGSDSASVHLSFLFTSNFSFITSIRGLHGEWVDSVHVRFIFLHVLATIILSHRHERLKGWLRIRIEFAKPVWGGRVCISNPWSSGDTEWFTVTCFSLMALDWRWSWRAAVCWLPLNFLLLETGVTWVILGPHGVIVRVRLMFWALTTNCKQVQHFFGNHVNNTRLIAMPKSYVIVVPFFYVETRFQVMSLL